MFFDDRQRLGFLCLEEMSRVDHGENQRPHFVLMIFHVGRRGRERHPFDHRHRRHFHDPRAELTRAELVHRADEGGIVRPGHDFFGPLPSLFVVGHQLDIPAFLQTIQPEIEPDVQSRVTVVIVHRHCFAS